MKPYSTSHPVAAVLLASAAALTACGGGSSAPTEAAQATDPSATALDTSEMRKKTPYTAASATATTSTPTVQSITLSNLPADGTTQTSASINYTGDPSYTVYCRLDSYAPIACPNPFQLGKTNPLAAGKHTVDYYMYTGTALDTAAPAVSYSWTIASSTTTATTSTTASTSSTSAPTETATTTTSTSSSTTSTSAGSSSVAPLPVAPVPVSTAVSGSSASWDGSTTISVNGVQLMAPVSDPNGSGRKVNLHRITQGGASIWGGVRSEQLWIGKSEQALTPGKDIWMAFAVQRKVGETFGSSVADDEHLVFQTHTPQPGATQPDIALFASGQQNYMGWRVAYNTSGTVDSQGWMSTEGNPWVFKEAPPAPGSWYRYVVHYRPGYLSSHNPLLEIWRAKPGEAYTQIVNHTGFNTYNTSQTGAGASYPRIGLYKWSDSVWNTSSLAWYLTPLYFGAGSNLLEAGKASLSGL